MTAKEFWKELAQTKNWSYTTGITGHFITRYAGQIRNNNRICPICAVANKKLKKRKYLLNAYAAGEYLGLNSRFINKIVCAADQTHDDGPTRNKLRQVLKLPRYDELVN